MIKLTSIEGGTPIYVDQFQIITIRELPEERMSNLLIVRRTLCDLKTGVTILVVESADEVFSMINGSPACPKSPPQSCSPSIELPRPIGDHEQQ